MISAIDVVWMYARIAELKAELAELESTARPAALALAAEGVPIASIEGRVDVRTVRGARRLDRTLVLAALGEERYAECHVDGEPQVRVEFRAMGCTRGGGAA